MSVVAPVAALASTVLPVGVAVAQGERPGPTVVAGAVICLAAIITSLYPGITVLLARLTLGERMRAVQRAGLALAAVGIVLLTV
jgi:drug/metabolite transporter (DMT)-like permease